ncbi:1-phosphofructokinase [Indioceanicola profundi]|uniref:1-phosphofructokinase n=1 Tax=Indioceanicola profundi TaxID=2220096 RepID=UPI000E6AC2DD|nr:1-phosphofructokinase [Indioceanicola profundi]
MTGPVITLTLNPAIDQTVSLDRLAPGAVNRASAVHYNAGGKGVNVASCLADWGVPTLAIGVLGADNSAPFEALFSTKGIGDRFLRRPGRTRTNIKLVEADGTTTDVNLPGLVVDAATCAELRSGLGGQLAPDGLAVLAGSLPAGLADGIYADLVGELAGAGVRVVLDASNAPLAAALAAPVLPYCIKPNRHELEAFTGRDLSARSDLLAAAGTLVERGVALAVVSLGAGGALFLSAEDAIHAALPPTRTPSTVGAGDAMVAGIVAGLVADMPLEALARLATAFAAGKLRRIGPHLPPADEVRKLAAAARITRADVWAAETGTGNAGQ